MLSLSSLQNILAEVQMGIQKHPLERSNPLPEDILAWCLVPGEKACIRRGRNRPDCHFPVSLGSTVQPCTDWVPHLGWASYPDSGNLGARTVFLLPTPYSPLGVPTEDPTLNSLVSCTGFAKVKERRGPAC